MKLKLSLEAMKEQKKTTEEKAESFGSTTYPSHYVPPQGMQSAPASSQQDAPSSDSSQYLQPGIRSQLPPQKFIPPPKPFSEQPMAQPSFPYQSTMGLRQAYQRPQAPPQPQKSQEEIEKERILELLARAFAEVKTPFRIIMLGGDPEYYKNIFQFFHAANENIQFLEHINGAGDKAYYDIEALDPDLVIIHHASPIQSATQFIQSLSTRVNSQNVLLKEAFKEKRILVIAPEDVTYELLLRQDLGVRHYIKERSQDNTVDIEAFAVNIKNAYVDIQNQKRVESIQTEATNEEYFLQQKTKKVNKVIGVYSATGGAGKTTFATSLAVVLGKYGNMNGNKSRVCLVEFTLGEKELDLFLGFRFDRNITGLARQIGPILHDIPENETKEQMIERKTRTFEAIRNHIYKDEKDNIDVLLGTDAQYDYDVLSEDFVNELFSCLRQMYDIVIVDFSTDMCRRQIILGLASMEEIYYLCPMEIPAIRNAKTLINVFTTQYGFRKESIKMVINKILPEELRAFSREEIAEHFHKEGIQIVGELPWEDYVSMSINRGEPLVRAMNMSTFNLAEGASNFAEAVYDIATQINEMLTQPLVEANDEKTAKGDKGTSGKKKEGLFGKIAGSLFSKKSKEDATPKKRRRKKSSDAENAPSGNLLRGRK